MEIKVGYQYFEIKEGTFFNFPSPVQVDLKNPEWRLSPYQNYYETIEKVDDFGTPREFARFFQKKNRFLCVRTDSAFTITCWAWGKTPDQALKAIDNPLLSQGFFQDSYMSYIYRYVLKVKTETPFPRETLRELFPIEFSISNTEKLRAKDKEGRYLLVSDRNIFSGELIFKYSGSPDKPLGTLVWGQQYLPECGQYIGDGKWLEADPVLQWKLNDYSPEEILAPTSPIALQRPSR